jgi:hypothetical protein
MATWVAQLQYSQGTSSTQMEMVNQQQIGQPQIGVTKDIHNIASATDLNIAASSQVQESTGSEPSLPLLPLSLQRVTSLSYGQGPNWPDDALFGLFLFFSFLILDHQAKIL